MSRNVMKGLAVGLGLFAGLASAKSAQINEIEGNDTLAGAQNVDSFFTLDSNAIIMDSTIYPHVSILGFAPTTSESPNYDVFKFNVYEAGLGIFDIDFGRKGDATTGDSTGSPTCPGPGCIDPQVKLFDSSFNLLWTADDAAIDPGSFENEDSFFNYTFSFSLPDTYYIQVGSFNDLPLKNQNGNYMLHISIENHPLMDDDIDPPSNDVPEPATLALLGMGLLGLGAVRRRRRIA